VNTTPPRFRPGERPLTLDGVPADMLARFDLAAGIGGQQAYRCEDPRAELVPIAAIVLMNPDRRLHRESLESILKGFRSGAALPPVQGYREPGATAVTLLAGMHRLAASRAVGFPMIPCELVTREDAEFAGYTGAPPGAG
jgi:hypothetical protein